MPCGLRPLFPFTIEPSRLGKSYIVDGGIVSNFPIWVFEKGLRQHSRKRPAIDIKLSALETVQGISRERKSASTFDYAFRSSAQF